MRASIAEIASRSARIAACRAISLSDTVSAPIGTTAAGDRGATGATDLGGVEYEIPWFAGGSAPPAGPAAWGTCSAGLRLIAAASSSRTKRSSRSTTRRRTRFSSSRTLPG